MSSGSKQTVLSVGILAVSTAFVAALMLRPPAAAAQGPVHLAVPPPREAAVTPAAPGRLRVCADPNNLPFSNEHREGFENRIADLVARDLHRELIYYWQPQRRGFIRATLNAGHCDLVMGVPAGFALTRNTRPYYRSTFVFVSRRSRHLDVRSLDDPRLRRLAIGIPMTGDDYDNPPPAQALAARRITAHVRGYTLYGDYGRPDPPRNLIDAVADGSVDVAIAWGPLAGYFARREPVALDLAPVTPERDGPGVQFAFDIAMGVRRSDAALAAALDDVLARRATEIRRLLDDYGVPHAGAPGRAAAAAPRPTP
jgi:quinoprotein dehydrogenase-associated probable ABC transporter substrate-binding protein